MTGRSGIRWTTYVVTALVILNAGWMLFDGTRALIVGDYVTPRSGPHVGQLGPWAGVVRSVGLDPRSTTTKLLFVGYGAVFLAVLLAYLMGAPRARTGMILVAVLGLWHLPFGTLINVVVIGLLMRRGAG